MFLISLYLYSYPQIEATAAMAGPAPDAAPMLNNVPANPRCAMPTPLALFLVFSIVPSSHIVITHPQIEATAAIAGPAPDADPMLDNAPASPRCAMPIAGRKSKSILRLPRPSIRRMVRRRAGRRGA